MKKKDLRRRIEVLEAEVAALKCRPPVTINVPPATPLRRDWWTSPWIWSSATSTASGAKTTWRLT